MGWREAWMTTDTALRPRDDAPLPYPDPTGFEACAHADGRTR